MIKKKINLYKSFLVVYFIVKPCVAKEIIMICDTCAYNEYDDDDEEYYCSVNMDEDEMARFMQSSYKNCPFYKSGDEYKVVRHQM